MNTGILNTELEAVHRITRDISDGLILIDINGNVLYINPSAVRILGNSSLKEGVKYAEYMATDESGYDAFHQYVLDSIYEKNVSHTGEVTYIRPNGSVRYLSIDTSYAHSDDGLRKSGVILRFSDVTELHTAKVKYDDTLKVLVGIIAVMAIWDYLVAAWERMGEPISSTALTVIIEVIGLIATLIALRYTSITVSDFGLGVRNLKKAVLFNSLLTLAVLSVMILAKFLARVFFPGIISPDEPFFHWNAIGALDLFYIPTVVVQEFLVRGVAQGSLERILPDTYPPAIAIIISSLFFGSIHIHKGIVFMLGATFLLSFFGIIYRKQRTIWGLCIPHLFLSWSLRVIWG